MSDKKTLSDEIAEIIAKHTGKKSYTPDPKPTKKPKKKRGS